MERQTGKRCPWAKTPLEIAYHDGEWGRPLHDERALFELLELEGFQAGLSWSLILERRAALREAFAGFDPEKLAAWGEEEVQRALTAPGVIRNRSKVHCAVTNAQAFLRVRKEFGSFDAYLWGWTEGKQLEGGLERMEDTPAQTELSRALSRDLKKRGFKFVGPVIVYSLMQAAGLVNDHLLSCPWHELCGDGTC